MERSTVLTELRLENCGLDEEGIGSIANVLKKVATLKVLDLSFNTIDSMGAKHLGNTFFTLLIMIFTSVIITDKLLGV